MKFAIDWCVFQYPDNPNITEANTQCADICVGPDNDAKKALTDRVLQTNATLQYQYCQNGAFQEIASDCRTCLENVPNAKAMANCTRRTMIPFR